MRPKFTVPPRRGTMPRFYCLVARAGVATHAAEGVSGHTLCGRFIREGWRFIARELIAYEPSRFTCSTCYAQVALARQRASIEESE